MSTRYECYSLEHYVYMQHVHCSFFANSSVLSIVQCGGKSTGRGEYQSCVVSFFVCHPAIDACSCCCCLPNNLRSWSTNPKWSSCAYVCMWEHGGRRVEVDVVVEFLILLLQVWEGVCGFTKVCWVGKHLSITMKPTNSPTQGQTQPKKN